MVFPPAMASSLAPTSEAPRYLLHAEAAQDGHVADVLFDGERAFPAMLEAIAAARTEILLESYIFLADRCGRRFIEALGARARAGVCVRLLVDGFGSFSITESWRDELCRAGVIVGTFHPVRPWRPRWAWSVRDHRKLLVVDGSVAFVGGMNLSDDYAPQEWSGRGWHDVQVRLTGPAVAELRAQFFEIWRYAVLEDGNGIAPTTVPAEHPPTGVQVVPVGVGRLRQRFRIRRHYQFLVRRATSSVRLMFGYFIPDLGWLRLLKNAARRGVDVRVMFPARSDVPAVQWAARATYGTLLRAGVQVHEWLPTMLHAKVLAVDGIACAIGSYNLDRRSLLMNWELSVVVAGGDAASVIERQFTADESRCRRVDYEAWKRRGLSRRLLEQLHYAFRAWL